MYFFRLGLHIATYEPHSCGNKKQIIFNWKYCKETL